jgi:hypothetical protein
MADTMKNLNQPIPETPIVTNPNSGYFGQTLEVAYVEGQCVGLICPKTGIAMRFRRSEVELQENAV